MIDQRKGFKPFLTGCVIALAMIGLAPSGAEAAGEFKIGGKTFAELKIEEETVTGKQTSVSELLIDGMNLKISCQKLEVSNGKLLLAGVAHATLSFQECTLLESSLPLKEISTCTVDNIKADVLAEAFLHGTPANYFLLVKPSSGAVFTTVQFLGAMCPYSEKNEVKGSAIIEAPNVAKAVSLLSVEQPEALFSKVVEGVTVKDGLKFGAAEKKAYLMAAGSAELTGKFKGFEWEVF